MTRVVGGDSTTRPRARSNGRSRRGRLSRSADFDRVYREGRSRANRYLVLHYFPRADGATAPRLGLAVGRKVGGAVERNCVKRLLREAFGAVAPALPAGHDYVLVARPEAGALAREEGERGIERVLRELVADTERGEKA